MYLGNGNHLIKPMFVGKNKIKTIDILDNLQKYTVLLPRSILNWRSRETHCLEQKNTVITILLVLTH
jgi:hypothetical protein